MGYQPLVAEMGMESEGPQSTPEVEAPRRRVCIIANPKAGQSRPDVSVQSAVEFLDELGMQVEVRETTAPGEATSLAAALNPGEFDVVIPGGGDGTVNEVLNGLRADIPIGILPLGTANVLARELHIPADSLERACEIVAKGAASPIDLGECNGRRFCLMAGIGFDAQAVREVPPSIKDLIGAPAYVLSGLRALVQSRRPIRYDLQITLPDRLPRGSFPRFRRRRLVVRRRVRAMMLVVANAGLYAGSLQLAPCASIRDGLLDVCLFKERGRLAFLGQLFNTALGRQHLDPNFTYLRASRLQIDCNPPAAIQLDGDYFARTPAEIRVVPAAVRVIQPQPVQETAGGSNDQ